MPASALAGDPVPIVVLTQAADSAAGVAADLADILPAGTIEIVRWPLLDVAPVPSESVASTLGRLAEYQWLFLPSPTAIEMMHLHLGQLGLSMPVGLRIGLTGPGSRGTFIRLFGDGEIVTPAKPPYDAAHLIEAIVRADPQRARGSALVAGRGLRPPWVAQLAETMDPVDVLALFDARPCRPPAAAAASLADWVDGRRAFCWVAGSRTQVDALATWVATSLTAPLAALARAAPVEVPHRDIARHAERAGFERVGVFEERAHLASKLQSWPRSSSLTQRGSADLATERPSDPGNASAATPPASGDAARPGAGPKLGQTPASPRPDAPKAEQVKAEQVKAEQVRAEQNRPDQNKADPNKPDLNKPEQAKRDPSGATGSRGDAPKATTAAAAPTASKTASKADAPAPSAISPPVPPQPPAPVHDRRDRGAGWVWPLLLLLLIAGLAVGGWWVMQQQQQQMQRASLDNARRVAEAEARAKQLEAQIKSIQDAQGQLLARSGRLEAKISESSEQQEQLTALYDDIAKNRGDGTLAEVEQSVVSAAQQLQLNGNVRAALIALENAQRRLGDSDRAETSIGLRRLIAQDIERLKALPAIDIAGSAGKLDDVIARVDSLQLNAEVSNPPEAGAAPAPAAAAAPAQGAAGSPAAGATPAANPDRSAFERMYDAARQAGTNGLAAVREEFGKLVSIRRIDKPDTMLMSPDQRRMARDNLRLQLLNARINLLNREQALFRKDLDTAIAGVERWFDTASPQVKQSIATLRSLQGQPLTMQYPDLSESLGAIRSAKAATEKGR